MSKLQRRSLGRLCCLFIANTAITSDSAMPISAKFTEVLGIYTPIKPQMPPTETAAIQMFVRSWRLP